MVWYLFRVIGANLRPTAFLFCIFNSSEPLKFMVSSGFPDILKMFHYSSKTTLLLLKITPNSLASVSNEQQIRYYPVVLDPSGIRCINDINERYRLCQIVQEFCCHFVTISHTRSVYNYSMFLKKI